MGGRGWGSFLAGQAEGAPPAFSSLQLAALLTMPGSGFQGCGEILWHKQGGWAGIRGLHTCVRTSMLFVSITGEDEDWHAGIALSPLLHGDPFRTRFAAQWL